MAYAMSRALIAATLLAGCSAKNPFFYLATDSGSGGADGSASGESSGEPGTPVTGTEGSGSGDSGSGDPGGTSETTSGPHTTQTTSTTQDPTDGLDDDGTVDPSGTGEGQCGDGEVQPPEQCDEGPGNDDLGECQSDCTFNECGDGFKGPDEACDLGPENNDPSKCSPTCELFECGDGQVSAGEQCDDGPQNGAGFGKCSPDCSGVVMMKKHIFRADTEFDGDLGGIKGADQICVNHHGVNFKAMLSDGVMRVASVKPYAGDGQKNWVLKPNVVYFSAIGPISVTGSEALLGVAGGQPVPLLGPISEGPFWTGLQEDWRSADKHCMGWSTGSDPGKGMTGDGAKIGNGEYLDGQDERDCDQKGRVYCVEQ